VDVPLADPSNGFEQGGFAGTISTKNHNDFSGLYMQGNFRARLMLSVPD
jgi:hypothetical protein